MTDLEHQLTRMERYRRALPFILLGMIVLLYLSGFAQDGAVTAQTSPTPTAPLASPAADPASPNAADQDAAERIERILTATGWFTDPAVTMDDGVVYLTGTVAEDEHKAWASDLAMKTPGVIAVVNKMDLVRMSALNFRPAVENLRNIASNWLRALPMMLFSLIVLVVTFLLSKLAVTRVQKWIDTRHPNPSLSRVAGYAIGTVVFLAGLYVILQISGLTNVAFTVLGGTGLVGLVVGIAFKDITENFLASIFLSLQNPFRTGDLVDIDGSLGYVQALTTRVTVLSTFDGNQLQLPNAAVYKSNILNYTSSPLLRQNFAIMLGFDAPMAKAQEVASRVLKAHPAVLKDPEPLALIDGPEAASVSLSVYFWIDITQHSMQKVKSALIIQLVKALTDAGIRLPDPAREVIFPEGMPANASPTDAALNPTSQDVTPESEDLTSEASDIQTHAEHGWQPHANQNLLSKREPGEIDAEKK